MSLFQETSGLMSLILDCFGFSVFGFQGTSFVRASSDSGDGEIRTLDPLLARQVLSQLSYAPIVSFETDMKAFFHIIDGLLYWLSFRQWA